MDTRWISLTLFTFLINISYAQKLISTIKLRGNAVKDMQAFAMGDSLFVSFLDSYPSFHTLLVLPDGSQKVLPVPELYGKILLSAKKAGDSVQFSYLEDKGKTVVLKITAVHGITGKRHTRSEFLTLPDNLIGSFFQKYLYLFRLQREDYSLRVSKLDGTMVIDENVYKVGKNVYEKLTSDVAFITNFSHITPSQAESRTKVYVFEKEIAICIDNVFESNTTLTRIDRISGDISTTVIPEYTNTSFRSALCNDLLYRIWRKKGISMAIYDGARVVDSISINKATSFSSRKSFMRNDASNLVLDNRTVWDAISNVGSVFISPVPIDSGSTFIQIGTHKAISKGTPILFGGIPSVMVASIFLRTLTNSIVKDAGIDHYFYLSRNAGKEFTYTDSPTTVQQSIDKYELFDFGNPRNYSFKGYLTGVDRVFGFYIVKKSDVGELLIVKF
ncbi:MAG TPA: hypothetical protein VD927_10315 [Chryseosolibacter sp.]|nr:hypothetical protein [Chryseosolibacter sp.]